MTGSLELPHHIVAHAYMLEPAALDACAARIGFMDWADLSRSLKFSEVGTGGGLSMLTAPLPDDHLLELTDGEADLPVDTERFFLSVTDMDGEALIIVTSRQDACAIHIS